MLWLWLGVLGVLGVVGVLVVLSLPQPITHKSTKNGGSKTGGPPINVGGITVTGGSLGAAPLTWFSAKNGELIKVNIVVIAISFFIINPVNFSFNKLLDK